MNSEQFIIFKQTLIQAVDQHLASGGTLSIGTFGSSQCLCPISCLIGEEGRSSKDKSSRALVNFISNKMSFSVSEKEIWDFIDGFDTDFAYGKIDTAMRCLGKELRGKYLHHLPVGYIDE
jgi:hypothetical protein